MSLICIRIRNSFPFEWLFTRTRFETEACSNSEMCYTVKHFSKTDLNGNERGKSDEVFLVGCYKVKCKMTIFTKKLRFAAETNVVDKVSISARF